MFHRLPSAWFLLTWMVLLWGGLYAIRLLGPPDYIDNAQERSLAYILDTVHNGNWICQQDHLGRIASKPPLQTWIAALGSLAAGEPNRFTITLPSTLSVLGTAWLIFVVGVRYFGTGTGFWGAVVFLLCSPGFKQVALVRTDPLFAFTTFLAALLLYRVWEKGRGWTVFWLAAAASTLAKGPLGLLLAFGGLLAIPWEYRSGERKPLLRTGWMGPALYVVLTLGWLILALFSLGGGVYDKMISEELVGHAVRSGKGDIPFLVAVRLRPPMYFLSRFAPWSILACLGFWRVWNVPSAANPVRRMERFLLCYFAVGLTLFWLAPHQRGDHLFPLLPAASILAGRELARLLHPQKQRWLFPSLGATCVFLGVILILYLREFRVLDEEVQHSIAMRSLAETIERKWGEGVPMDHVDTPVTLQYYLNSMRYNISYADAARILTDTPGPDHELELVALEDWEYLNTLLPKDQPVKVWMGNPQNVDLSVSIVSAEGGVFPQPAGGVSTRRVVLGNGLLLLLLAVGLAAGFRASVPIVRGAGNW